MSRLHRKRGRPSNYRKSLKNNDYWNTVKRKVRIRDNFQCVVCGSKIKLETHHISYQVNGNSILGKELDYLEWMCTLCEKDHQNAHNDLKHPLNPKNAFKTNIYDFINNRADRNNRKD